MEKSKKKEMDILKKEVVNLTSSPLYSERIKHGYVPVIGEGSFDAEIMFIGEAPGKNEAETGKPFCGRAGQILNEMLESIDLPREDVYITNIVKDRPPENRDPLPEEITLYAPFLDRQIEIIQPQIIATLGRFSMNYVLERYGSPEMLAPISQNHGKIFEVEMSYGTIKIIPLYHPAGTIYNKTIRANLKTDFQILKH